MERWFDLHLYLANWSTRRLMLRVPKRLVNRTDIESFLHDIDWVEVWTSGDNLIVDICRNEVEVYDDWQDGSGQLAALAPLRADVLSGDFRLFYLLWLASVQDEFIPEDELEPLPGIAPLTGALEGFAEFFGIDLDLVEAAAELGAGDAAMNKGALRKAIAAIPEREKADFLLRVADGDSHVAAELRNRVRKKNPRQPSTVRPVCCACGRRRSRRHENASRPNVASRNGVAKRRRRKKHARAAQNFKATRRQQRMARDRARNRTSQPDWLCLRKTEGELRRLSQSRVFAGD